ncbi:MAG: GNAT family N-acetyltransferase [Candidatus Pacebacteria bacterium]|nr:GNAT family N-acetyltransferase [Candidatus Paceibacterota bacterium]
MISVCSLSDTKTKEIWEVCSAKNDLWSPFSTHVWHTTWFEVFGAEYEPLYLNIDGNIIAPFVKKGYSVMFSGGVEISDYMDIIGDPAKKHEAWEEILTFCSQHGYRIELRNVPASSPTFHFFQKDMVREDTTPIVQLPTSWDAYVESLDKHKRHELRRKMRNIEEKYPGIHLERSEKPEHDIAEFLHLMQGDEKKRMFLTEDMRKFFTKLAHVFSKEVQLLFCVIDGKHVSATLSFEVGDAVLLYNSGVNVAKYPNVGFYTKASGIKYAIEHEFREYNFLQGNERYKYDLGGEDFLVYSAKMKV